MVTISFLSILGILYTTNQDKYFRIFFIFVFLSKVTISLLLFYYYEFDISNIFGDQLVYIENAVNVYNSDNPFGTYGNISHYLYIYMLTILLNIYDSLFISTIDLVFSQVLVSILTHIYFYFIISEFIIIKKNVFKISLITLFFLTMHSYNIFLIRDSWFFLFFIMSIYYLVKLNKTSKKKYLIYLVLSLVMLLQMRFFTSLFFIVAYYVAFTKNKFKMIILFFSSFIFFIFSFSLFYNANIIHGYLMRLLELENLIEFIFYNIEGFFNLSFIRYSEYSIAFKFIRLFIPETIFVLISTYIIFKLKKYKMYYLDTLIKFIIILTFFHVSTYFFYSGAEWKIRQGGIISLLFVILITIKYFIVKKELKHEC
jgi:hypothetical protein